MSRKVFIIAEAGVNHNGSLKIARKMVDAAAAAGCDAVKFQTFKASNVAVPDAKSAEYRSGNCRKRLNQVEMLKLLELSRPEFAELFLYCRRKRILFISTPFDLESVDFLDSLDMRIFKISSGEITNKPLIARIAGKRKPIILSTGMSYPHEIKEALRWIARVRGNTASVSLLHCVSEYPASPARMNLLAMRKIGEYFSLPFGLSDHTLGVEVAVAALALGARIIEKHFTLSREMDGPDHKASIEPPELRGLVVALRNVEMAMGDGKKKPTPEEMINRRIGRRSIVAACDIHRGERFSFDTITAKRPADGISAACWDSVIGKTARKDFKKDELITL